MKKVIYLLGIVFISCLNLANAQDPKYSDAIKDSNVKRFYYLETAYFKTTHIIFPTKIKYSDVGSDAVVIEAAEEVDNVLKLKANQIGFPETNVSVITEDGSFYSFIISYSERPKKLSFDCKSEDIIYDKEKSTGGSVSSSVKKETEKKGDGVLNRDHIMFSKAKFGVKELNRVSELLVDYNQRFIHIGDKTGKVRFHLNGVYAKENFIFLSVELENDSELPYSVDFIKAYVRDVEQKKKELYQEYEIPIVYNYWASGEQFKINSKSNKEYVLMVDTFQMQEGKRLEIDINEKKGGRNCSLKIEFRTFEELLKKI